MFLTHCKTQKKVRARVDVLDVAEVKTLLKTGRFGFDWLAEMQNNVYALTVEVEQETVGLMALKDFPGEFRLEILLLESSTENIGKSKVYNGIAGCLIAFACRLAFLKGYDGFVSLTPKTALVTYYQQAYGFKSFGRQLALEGETALSLIKKYIENG